ncbi:amidase [Actinomadura rupiterrae]|uniref:amidase n=1 Tax=Actinomadura rupiterrae TaxID=559627 RepID=UPI0020A45E02|nr:amidase [Actinomadura rupiterrae]MCP2342587.1 amidase [Actinomadura rupiterrae]
MASLADETRWMDATEQAALVSAGQVTPAELLEAAIERITDLDPGVNAVVMRWFDEARTTASGPLPDGPFRGVPFLLKDFLVAYAGQPRSDGNVRLKKAAVPATADSAIVARFRAAGLVTAGRTNSAEFGSLPTTEPAAWGPTRNPWDPGRSAGGSSGGSAAAVASGMVPVAHASDGGGSIRVPASCCGLVGLKPSQGRVTLAPDGDESGPGVHFCHTRSVRDAAAMLDAVSGPGVGDTVIAPPPARPYARELGAEPGPLRIGLLDHYPWGEAVHDACATAARDTGRLLESLGHRVEHGFPAALADRAPGSAAGLLRTVSMGAVAARLAESLRRPVTADDMEPINWALARQAREVTAVDYARALEGRTLLRRAIHRWWADGFDLLLTPTTGEPPSPLGAFSGSDLRAVGMRSRRAVAFTQPFNISGQPAISLPLHRTADGLPIGVQLVAAYGREDVLLRVAHQLEQARPWAGLTPPDVPAS